MTQGVSAYTGGYNQGFTTQPLGNPSTSSGDAAYDAANGLGQYDTSGQGGSIVTPNGQAPPNITNYVSGPQAGSAVIQAGSNGGPTPWDATSKDAFGYGFNDTGNPASGGGYTPGQSYDAAVNTAAGQANNYNSMAQQAAMNVNAPTINNPYAQQSQQNLNGVNATQNALVANLGATAKNGQNSLAYQQYQSGVKQGLQSQVALANSAGGGVAGAGARRMAQQGNAMTAAGSQAGGQTVAANAQQAAQAQLGTVLGQQGSLQNQNYSQGNQLAYTGATMQQQQQNIANAGVLGYNSLAQNEQGTQLNALQGASNALLASEGLGQQQQSVNNAQNAVYMGAATQAGSGIAGALGNAYVNSNNASTPSGPSESQLENPYYQGS